MAIAHVQHTGGANGSTANMTVAFGSNITSGNLITIPVSKFDSTAFAVGNISQSAGTATLGAFTLDIQHNRGGTDLRCAIFSAPVTGTGSCTIQVSAGGAVAWVMGVLEASGVDTTASRLEDSEVGDGSSTTPATASGTSAGEALFVGAQVDDAGGVVSHTPGTGYNDIFEFDDGGVGLTGEHEYQIVSSGTSDTADWTLGASQVWACCLAVYKTAANPTATVAWLRA